MDPSCHHQVQTQPKLQKKKIYQRLQDRYYLLGIDSHRVTHAYLCQVERQEVFVVGHQEMARFLAELAPCHLKCNPHCSRYEAFDMLKALLEEQRLPPLGFDDDQIPEGPCLYSILRFVDQMNLSGVFTKAVRGIEQSQSRYGSEQLFMLQRKAGHELLSIKELGKRPEIQDYLEELWLAKRKVACRKAEATAALNHAKSWPKT